MNEWNENEHIFHIYLKAVLALDIYTYNSHLGIFKCFLKILGLEFENQHCKWDYISNENIRKANYKRMTVLAENLLVTYYQV